MCGIFIMPAVTEQQTPAVVQNATAREESPSAASDVSHLVIVGGGMAGYGLCDRLVRSQACKRFHITVFGDEPHPAYDRVNLSKLFDGRSASDLSLADRSWYDRQDIVLRTGCRIVRVDRQAKQVIDQSGQAYRYDRLVLATGSSAWVPPVEGANSPGVFVYRTLDDLQQIDRYVRDHGATAGAVLGGGLLGLEAAKVLNDLGLQTEVIEMAPGLMPRQLDAKAAAFLKERVESIGVNVHLVRRTERIECRHDRRLRIHFGNADPCDVDVLIIAAGVRPNDLLAKGCDLEVGPRGGIVVDKRLQTNDPQIHAIGECVSYRDHIYGLVAPCYRMADVLANRLAGNEEMFEGADESAELKLLGVQVAALGRAIGESPSGITLIQNDESGYRKLILEQGRVVGAACVGTWEALPQIRQAINRQSRLWPTQRTRFRKTGSPWIPGGPLPVVDWPSDSVVCSCLGITKGTLCAIVDGGVTEPAAIAERSGASTACGSCRSLVCELAGHSDQRAVAPGSTAMFAASIVAALLSLILASVPPIPFAESVQGLWRQVDLLWRSDLLRQITGFTLLGLTLIGLTFSLRKRWARFQWGSYRFWRTLHGVLGASVLIAMAVHTGMSLGENLNFVLACVFLATALLGSLTGIASSLEAKAEGNRAMQLRIWRPRLTRLHTWLFWPLPALIAIHIFSFYWFSD